MRGSDDVRPANCLSYVETVLILLDNALQCSRYFEDFQSDLFHSAVNPQFQCICTCFFFSTLNGAKCVPNQLLVAEEESQKKQQYGIIQELLRESNSLREELHNLRCLTKIKAEERGQKHRELLRAEVQFKHTQTQVHKSIFKIGFDVVVSVVHSLTPL